MRRERSGMTIEELSLKCNVILFVFVFFFVFVFWWILMRGGMTIKELSLKCNGNSSGPAAVH